MLLLLIFVVTFASGIVIQGDYCSHSVTRNDLLGCFTQLVDLDSNGNITSTEITTFLAANVACLPNGTTFSQNVNASSIMRLCDVNSDGNLTQTPDWDSAGSCLRNRFTQKYICNLCFQCGWQLILINKKKKIL